jgi:endonuclease G
MNAGAHDGRSSLELAFDAFSNRGTLPGLVIVKSAGNERGKAGHARLTIAEQGADSLVWRCPQGSGKVHVELWWKSGSDYQFQLKSPQGDVSEWVHEKNPDLEGYFKKRGPFEMKLVKRHPDNGDNLLKIEVDNGVIPVANSDWTLKIRAVRVRPGGDLHAWIEREGQAQAQFLTHQNEDMTLSIPGTSDSVITVSAIDPDPEIIDGKMAIEVGTFSSYGPTRDGREKPDIAAPGVRIKAARRDTPDGVIEMCGTSMAAPHLAGAVALLLSRMAKGPQPLPTATQISSVLREKTINYSGIWDRGQGYGVLDVKALLEAF